MIIYALPHIVFMFSIIDNPTLCVCNCETTTDTQNILDRRENERKINSNVSEGRKREC